MSPSASLGRFPIDEFLKWADQPENSLRRWELHDGEPIEMPPPGGLHALVCGLLAGLLHAFALGRRQGMVLTNDSGLLMELDPPTILGPDLMFYSESRPFSTIPTGPMTEMPTLVVEVRSPSDRTALVQAKVNRYLRAGIPLVWVIDPQRREVIVYRNGELTEVFEEGDVLNGGAVLPGLTLPVAALFSPIGTSGMPTPKM